MELFIIIFQQVLCLIPTVWEVWDDRFGEEKGDKFLDIIVRIFLSVVVSVPSLFVHWVVFLISIFLTLSYHFMFFDYAINIVLRKNDVIRPDANWFTYMGKTASTDQIKWWRADPWLRILIRVTVLLFFLAAYFIALDLFLRDT